MSASYFTLDYMHHGHFPALKRAEAILGGWTLRKWKRWLDKVSCTGFVATDYTDRPVGWCLAEFFRGRIVVRRLVVEPGYRRQGVGAAFLEKMRLRLPVHGNSHVAAWSDVAAVGTNEFFKACGFTAERVKGDRIRFAAGPVDGVPAASRTDVLSQFAVAA